MVHKPWVLSNCWKDISHESPPTCMNFLKKKKKSVFSDKTNCCHSNSHVPNYNPGWWKRASWQNRGDLGLLSTRTRQSGKRQRKPGSETYGVSESERQREASSGLRQLLTCSLPQLDKAPLNVSVPSLFLIPYVSSFGVVQKLTLWSLNRQSLKAQKYKCSELQQPNINRTHSFRA